MEVILVPLAIIWELVLAFIPSEFLKTDFGSRIAVVTGTIIRAGFVWLLRELDSFVTGIEIVLKLIYKNIGAYVVNTSNH